MPFQECFVHGDAQAWPVGDLDHAALDREDGTAPSAARALAERTDEPHPLDAIASVIATREPRAALLTTMHGSLQGDDHSAPERCCHSATPLR